MNCVILYALPGETNRKPRGIDELIDPYSDLATSVNTERNSIGTGCLSAKGNFGLGTLDLSGEVRLRRGLPASDFLLSGNLHGSSRTIFKILRHNFGISGTDVGNVGGFAGLLELVGEYGDSDGDEDSDDRNNDQQLGQGKALVVFLQISILLIMFFANSIFPGYRE